MSERNSPAFRAGVQDGAADALRRPGARRGFDPSGRRSWMYKRGFARAFLAVRRADADTLQQLQAALGNAWAALDTGKAPQ